MIGLLPTTTIFLASAPTDLRKAYDGLAALVRQSLGQDPLNGSLYVFCNRRKDRVKILFWEEGGYWLCARRWEEGTFRWPSMEGACARYRREELLLLLGGIDLVEAADPHPLATPPPSRFPSSPNQAAPNGSAGRLRTLITVKVELVSVSRFE